MSIVVENKSLVVDKSSTFELRQREATIYATSPLVPEHLRKDGPKVALANCYIAMEMAELLNESPLVVMQNIYIVHGKAGWSAQYIIGRANKSGKFRGPISWTQKGQGDSLEVTAFATIAETNERVEYTVTMKAAKAEGWTSNKKYQSLPELMLRYRSATFLVRLYAPEVMLGYQTREEIDDVIASEATTAPRGVAGIKAALGIAAMAASDVVTDDVHSDDQSTVGGEPAQKPKPHGNLTEAKAALRKAAVASPEALAAEETRLFEAYDWTEAEANELDLFITDAKAGA